VAVLNAAKVRDLRQAVMKYIDSMEQDQLGHRHISWWVGRILCALLDWACIEFQEVLSDTSGT
jgi:hypothetical protein